MANQQSIQTLGVVVPTLGTREKYLAECLTALQSDKVFIVVVGPQSVRESLNQQKLRIDSFLVEEPGDLLATSINKAIAQVPDDIEFVTWVGDDDVLSIDTILLTLAETDKDLAVLYGDCEYIDENGKALWTNRPGEKAMTGLSHLPQRISQPASLVRHTAWKQVAGLNPQYRLAFDYDILIRLSRIGRFHYFPRIFASYRWHKDALSVKSRRVSVREAFQVRNAHRSRVLNFILIPLEIMLVAATYLFGMWLRLTR